MNLPTFIEKSYIEKQVGDKKDVRFYKLSISTIFRIKKIATHVAQALTVLFSSLQTDQDRDVVDRTVYVPDVTATTEAGETVPLANREIIQKAIDPTLAKERYQQRRGAINDLLEGFLADGNRTALGLIIRDSMRDCYPADTDPLEIIDSLEAETFIQIMLGVGEANKGLLGPFANFFQKKDGLLEKIGDKVSSQVAQMLNSDKETSNEENDPANKEAETPQT